MALAARLRPRGEEMDNELKVLLEKVKSVRMSESERDEQRRSFVYGNTGFENALITREMVDEVAESLKARKAVDD
jgi:hypothetical protein